MGILPVINSRPWSAPTGIHALPNPVNRIAQCSAFECVLPSQALFAMVEIKSLEKPYVTLPRSQNRYRV